jgi:hypothetical protein
LPSEPCDNCTLQLVQIMNGDTDNPVNNVFGTETYYQCADIVIRADASGDPPRAKCKAGPVGGCGGCSGGTVVPAGSVLGGALLLRVSMRWRRRSRHQQA